MANLEPNICKRLISDKFYWDGIDQQVWPTLRTRVGDASPEVCGFCGEEINSWAIDSMRKKGGGKWILDMQLKKCSWKL